MKKLCRGKENAVVSVLSRFAGNGLFAGFARGIEYDNDNEYDHDSILGKEDGYVNENVNVNGTMKRRWALGAVLCICALMALVHTALGAEYNMVHTTTHDGVNELNVKSFSDGLGRGIQDLLLFPDGSDLVSGQYYDTAGRAHWAPKPFIRQSGYHEFIPMDEYALIMDANAYYLAQQLDVHGYSFTRTEYWPDPLGRARAVGMPGIDF